MLLFWQLIHDSHNIQYKINNSAYCKGVHPVAASTPVRMYPKDTVDEFYPNNIPNFLGHAPLHPDVVPLLTEEQERERGRVYQRSYSQQHREQGQAYQLSYNQSKAKQCSFSDCKKQGQFKGICAKHHKEKRGRCQKIISVLLLNVKNTKQVVVGECALYIAHCTEYRVVHRVRVILLEALQNYVHDSHHIPYGSN